MRLLLFSFCCFLLIAFNAEAAISDIPNIYHEVPTLDALDVCFGGGCAEIRHISISSLEWAQVVAIFTNKPAGGSLKAEQERKQIAEAVGKLETIVGVKIGTLGDRAGTFNNSKYPGQLDCNDEAINTLTYIRLMQYYGLIKLHAAENLHTRGFFLNGWPHSTAAMREKATSKLFAVDSWFYDNGVPATIMPFDLWKSGYIPEDSPVRTR